MTGHALWIMDPRNITGGGYREHITRLAGDWKRTLRADGGCWQGMFSMAGLTDTEIIHRFSTWLGCQVAEFCAGIPTWLGIVYEMRLRVDGVEYVRSLASEYWASHVKVLFTDEDGIPQETDWTTLSDLYPDGVSPYGRMEYIAQIGDGTGISATAAANALLAERGAPRTRVVGGRVDRRTRERAQLSVTATGYWATLNWKYYQGDEYSNSLDQAVPWAANQSEFVVCTYDERNTMTTLVSGDQPQRLGDIIQRMAEQGAADGRAYMCGVYADGLNWYGRNVPRPALLYERVPTTAEYQVVGGVLCSMLGAPMEPPMVLPGRLVSLAPMSPTGMPSRGTAASLAETAVAFIEEVQWGPKSGLELRLKDGLMAFWSGNG